MDNISYCKSVYLLLLNVNMVIEIINLVFVFVFCMNYFFVSLKVRLDLLKNIVSTQILILVKLNLKSVPV